MAWIVPPLIAIEMVKVQMALYWARVLMCLNVCCLSASWRLSYREVFILQTGAYGESGCCLALTNILLKSSLSVNECDSQNASLFFLWDIIHFLFSSNAFPSIFNGVCWKLVNQENWMRSLRNICAWHNCIRSNNQRRNYSTREVKWGVARRLFIIPM